MKLPVHTVSAAGLVQRGDEVLLIKIRDAAGNFPADWWNRVRASSKVSSVR